MKQTVTSVQALSLLEEQLKSWELARNNYYALGQVKTRELDFDTFKIKIQFNPARIVSSAAKVDAKSLKERQCFLCSAHLPNEQKGLPFGEDYQVLVNPFPIFPEHLTIPTLCHKPQNILPRFGDMLDLANALDKFVIFYNGPRCGASAPDHAHFQAGSRGFLPIEKEWKATERDLVWMREETSVYALKNYLRNVLVIESRNKKDIVMLFEKIYGMLELAGEEPLMNLLAWCECGWWVTCIFPRVKHRPPCYFAEGNKNLLLSPASVDMGGVFITPLAKDFDKVTKEDARTIFQEISISDTEMDKLVERLNKEI